MVNRLISNLVLGFFVMVLVVAYGIAKQAPEYNDHLASQQLVAGEMQDAQTLKGFDAEEHRELMQVQVASLVMPNGRVIAADVAETETERQQGLSGTDLLPDGRGMLFVFPESDLWGIWMKGMKYDLDIVWFDESGKVVEVVEGAKAPTSLDQELEVYSNDIPALYVLEVPAGKAAEYGLTAGEQIKVS